MGTQKNPPIPGSGIHPNLENSGWDNAWNQNLAIDTETFQNKVNCNLGTWTSSPGVNENLPMTCVSWYEAMAFCIWDGGYLPTEAEWNYAASGGSEQRAYPWSNPANSIDSGCPYANNSCGGKAIAVGSKSPKGDSRWHHSDLSGNIYEWALDWYMPYPSSPCSDCAYLMMPSETFPERVARGGDFSSVFSDVRTAARHGANPDKRYIGIGLRCARRAL
jgi:formylglycine-generating enzyme required for sulfatase activity